MAPGMCTSGLEAFAVPYSSLETMGARGIVLGGSSRVALGEAVEWTESGLGVMQPGMYMSWSEATGAHSLLRKTTPVRSVRPDLQGRTENLTY